MIEVDNLVRSFGAKRAVDGISFTVAPGEVVGLLGPNGAGKSTTMRAIAGYYVPSAGTIRVCGVDVAANPVGAKRCLGYLPENAPAYPDMTVGAQLAFAANIHGMRGDARGRAMRRAIDACALGDVLGETIDTLSKGFRHRLGLALAILHDPPVLILDEPTDGLDPNQKREARTLIARLRERKAILLSTHILEEVELACTRVVVVNRGKIVASGTPEALKARCSSGRLDDVFRMLTEPVADLA